MSKDPLNSLKQSLDQLLQADTSIKRKNKKSYDQKRELFINIINQFEHAISKSYLLEKDFKIDMSKYEESFYQIIDSLILLSFGKDVYELLSFYFYERYNPDGSENGLIIDETDEEVFVKDAVELWDLIIRTNPNIFDGKTG
jgi:ATP-dependent exoDNAse (exonuclease V) beta subunit|tara:strand:+ start:213 stop:638 length:426 start_codon:yes stop_codon:yes gene_type:complete